MMTIVVPKTGFYLVGTPSDKGLQTEQVDKAKRCTCGGTREQPFPDVCPICGAAVIAQADHWRCTESAGHYWQYRGEQSGVKAFLTQPHPAKQGAFYEQSIDERDAFLEQVSHRRHGYSPYQPKGV